MAQSLDILIVEDEASQRTVLKGFLKKLGHRVLEAEDGNSALSTAKDFYLDLVLLDLKMPGMDGIQVLKELKRLNPELEVILITAYGTIDTAVTAIKSGAFDYLTKPVDLEELVAVIDKVARQRQLMREVQILRQQLQEKVVTQSNIVYGSQKMAELLSLCSRIAPSRATVLIQGESGTGKELIARLIHGLSPRQARPLIAVNCGALPETLIESELFGHEKGAFTGAVQRRIGKVEQADGGTLFLDEIGELSLGAQVKLLRFLQEGEFQRLGGSHTLRADVRVIVATNRDLQREVREGRFREDLYYRLNVIQLSVPPLRERKEDIPVLIEHFIKVYGRQNKKEIKGLSAEARSVLMKYHYPGNVRELENIIERAVVISKGQFITLEDLPFGMGEREKIVGQRGHINLKERVEALEKELISEALKDAEGNQTRAALSLGISERMLRYKLKKYGLK